LDADIAQAQHIWQAIAEIGVDHAAVAQQLEREGVNSFQKSFDELLAALTTKAAALRAG
jgi:transaldolase